MDKYEAVKNLKIISAGIDEHKTCSGRHMDYGSSTKEAIKKKNMKNKYLHLLRHTTNTRNCGEAVCNRECRHLDRSSSKEEEMNRSPCNDFANKSSRRLKHVETCDGDGKLDETRTSTEFLRYCNDPVEHANQSTGLFIANKKICAQENTPPGGRTKGKEKTNLISFYKYNNLINKHERPGSVDASAAGLVGLPADDEQYTVKCSLNSLIWKRLLMKGCGSSQDNRSASSTSKICQVASSEDAELCKLYREEGPRGRSNYAVENGARGGKGGTAKSGGATGGGAKAGQPRLADGARRDPAESALVNCFLKERLGNRVVSSRLGSGTGRRDRGHTNEPERGHTSGSQAGRANINQADGMKSRRDGGPPARSRKGKASSEETSPSYCLGQAATNDRKSEESPNCRFCVCDRDTRVGSDSISYGEHAAVLKSKERNHMGTERTGASGEQKGTHRGSTGRIGSTTAVQKDHPPFQEKGASSGQQNGPILPVEGKTLRGNANASKKAHSDSMLPSCKKLTTSEFRSRGKNASAGNVPQCIRRSEEMEKARRRPKSRDPKGGGDEPLGRSYNESSGFYKGCQTGREQGGGKNKKLGTVSSYNKFSFIKITKKKSIFCYSEFVDRFTPSGSESEEEVPSDWRENVSRDGDVEVGGDSPLDDVPMGGVNRGMTLQRKEVAKAKVKANAKVKAKAKMGLPLACRKTNQGSSSVPILEKEDFNFSTLKRCRSLDKVVMCGGDDSGYAVRCRSRCSRGDQRCLCRGGEVVTKVEGSSGEKGCVRGAQGRQMEEEKKKEEKNKKNTNKTKKTKKKKSNPASTRSRVSSRGEEAAEPFPPPRAWTKSGESRHINESSNERFYPAFFSYHPCVGVTQNGAPQLAAEKGLKKISQGIFSERVAGGKNQMRSSPVGDTLVGCAEEPPAGRTKALCEGHLASVTTGGRRERLNVRKQGKRERLNVKKERKMGTAANRGRVANRKGREHRTGSRYNLTRDSPQGREKKKKKLGSQNGEETTLERRQKGCLLSHDSLVDLNCPQQSAVDHVMSAYPREEVEEDSCEKGKTIRVKGGSNKDGRVATPHEEDVPCWTTSPCEMSSSICVHPKCTYYNKIYRIVGLIYCGEKSQVYKCMNVLNKKSYAMKVIVREERDAHHTEKFFQNYLFLKQTKHRNVIPIYDIFLEGSFIFIVMEYCEGCTLLDYFMSLVPGSLDIQEIKCIMKNLLLGLDFLHSNNIIHRDVKLENIMFKRKRKRDYAGGEFGSCALRARGAAAAGGSAHWAGHAGGADYVDCVDHAGYADCVDRVGRFARAGEPLPSEAPSSGGSSSGVFSSGIFSYGGSSNGGFSSGVFSNGGFSSGVFSNGVFSNGGFSSGVFSNGGFSNEGSSSESPLRTSTVLSAHSKLSGSSATSKQSSITVNSFHSHGCDGGGYSTVKRGQDHFNPMSHEGNYMQSSLLMKRYHSRRRGQKNISLLRFPKNEGTRCSTFREITKNYITKKRRRKEGNSSYSDLCLIDMDMMEKVPSSKSTPNRRSQVVVICGTAPYMSPESLDGVISTANDVWACGVILYALMDGRFPFQISNDMPVPLKKKILIHTKPNFDPFIWHDHPDVLDLCLKLLDPNPLTRIQNAREALIHYCFAEAV
ncbi:serine/threonine protein kinase, putative [Plasmodium vivax]|uniref:Serine/threonine protein kinase, putative n=1 Tax=Plasmodium vivax TaxID=5855 RepID=A0A1G4H820_PLAVI|nr:serine/threonine protein kinase, putative [Plasmodium vivax]